VLSKKSRQFIRPVKAKLPKWRLLGFRETLTRVDKKVKFIGGKNFRRTRHVAKAQNQIPVRKKKI